MTQESEQQISEAEAERKILEQRARALASPRSAQRAGTEKWALFERSGVRYAIEPRFVFAVARAREPTPLPGAPAYWSGVSSVHGELLALVDLPALLDRSGAAEAPATEQAETDSQGRLVLVLGLGQREFGLVIDALLEASSLPVDVLRTPAGDPSSQLIFGSTADGTRIVRGDALLSDARLFIQENHFNEA